MMAATGALIKNKNNVVSLMSKSRVLSRDFCHAISSDMGL
jgi:hypothetical protein